MTEIIKTITLGCRLNGAESEAMRRLAEHEALGDTVIINTCAVTNAAVATSRQRIRRAKRDNPGARIVATGCAAQLQPEAFADMAEVDAVIGNGEKLKPATWKTLARAGDETVIAVNDIMSVRTTAEHLAEGYGDRARAFLQIQNGCDHRCTFCIIPFGRGNSRSAKPAQVIEQAKRLVDAGHPEIVLTGVDITSYGGDLETPVTLGALVRTVLDETPGLLRLRLSSIDGAEIDDELFDLIRHDHRIAPHLHLSLQAGDDLILKRMKRRHSRAQAIELCRRIRADRPDIAYGADIIAGFPTETEDQFQASLDIIDEAGLNYIHVFPFSPRDGAPAARMPQVRGPVIQERAARLRAAGDAARHRFLDTLAGRTEIGVVESGGVARLGNFALVKLSDPERSPGTVISLKLGARAGDIIQQAQ